MSRSTSRTFVKVGNTPNQPVDLTADDNEADDDESSDDPLAEPVPNEYRNPGPSNHRNVASSSRSHRKHRDGSRMQVSAEKKERKYGWDPVHGGGQSSSNPITLDDDSEDEESIAPQKSNRRPHKDQKISTLESQLAQLRRDINDARDEQERIRLQRDYESFKKVLERTRTEQANSRRAAVGVVSPMGAAGMSLSSASSANLI